MLRDFVLRHRKSGALVLRRPKAASGDDVSVRTRFVGVNRNRFVGFEVEVAFDRKPEFAADGAKLGEAHVAEFRAA